MIGILSSSEPLVGGVIGLLLLGEGITWVQLIAFELITLASLGSSLDDAETSNSLIAPELRLTIPKDYN